jgi:hypothetical protein
MAELQRVHCKHCGQTLLTNNTDKCDACGKPPVRDADPTDPAALRDLVAAKQREGGLARADRALQPVTGVLHAYRMVRVVAGFSLFILVSVVLGMALIVEATREGHWTVRDLVPGVSAIVAGLALPGFIGVRILFDICKQRRAERTGADAPGDRDGTA